MKKFLVLILVCSFLPIASMAQSSNKKTTKEVSPFIDGRQKVRKTDYDSIWKFTSFDAKKIYFCDYNYTQFCAQVEERKPKWDNFNPVMNFLTTSTRSPMRICAVFAINPNIDDNSLKESLIEQGRAEALESVNCFVNWMAEKEMKNKVQVNVAQVDYRYWQGTDYFMTEQTSDALIQVGLILYFGTKKINLFPSAAEGAQEFRDVKFFPNDATVVESYDSYLDDLAKYLKENDRLEVLLKGYTDNQGTAAYCTGLARQRCTEIKKKLLARGIPEYRIEIEAKGSDDPIGDNNTYEGRIANNRVSVVIQ